MLLDAATQTPEPPPLPRDSTPAPRQAAAEPQTAAPSESVPAENVPAENMPAENVPAENMPDAKTTGQAVNTGSEIVPSDDALPVAECAEPGCKLPVTLTGLAIPAETADETKDGDAATATPDTAADPLADTLLTTLPEIPQPTAAPVPVPSQVQGVPPVQAEVVDGAEAAAIQGAEATVDAPKPAPLTAAPAGAESTGAESADAEITAADTPEVGAAMADAAKSEAPKSTPKSAPVKPGALKIHPLTAEASEAKSQAELTPSADNEAAADQIPAAAAPPRAAKPATPAPAAAPHAADAAAAVAPHPGDVAARLGADIAPQFGAAPFVHSTVASSQSQHAALPAAPQTDAGAVPVAGLAVAIAAQAQAGKSRFEIRLDPPELGRIHVRLDIDRDGNVASRLVVERQDTLDLLRRDASQLERALQQAGLKTSDNALEFSLRGHAFGRDDETPELPNRLVIPEDDAAPLEALRHGYGRVLGLGGGIDIRV